jgi:hypothetical protein
LSNDAPTNNNYDLEYLLNLADHYDQLGLYSRADEIFQYLKAYYKNLPQEIQLRINDRSHGTPDSMSNAESGQGSVYLKGGTYAYLSGKGQAAYRDRLPSNQLFV